MEYGRAETRQVLALAAFILVIGSLFALNFIVVPPEVLVSERRVPAAFPELSVHSVLSADFMSKFENYAADRFPFRDVFRTVHAAVVLDVLKQNDKSGIYRDSAVGVGEFRSIDETAFRQTARKIRSVAETLSGMRIYYALVPDKSMFAERYTPGYDHSRAESLLTDMLTGYTYISLDETLSAESFYKTDLHWNQIMIDDTVDHILDSMDTGSGMGEYRNAAAGVFRGVYAGQLALPVEPDLLSYKEIPDIRVKYLSEKTLRFEEGEIYEPERFLDVDPYNIFLRGPQPLIVLENENAESDRELFLFRDSFGSSLAPLLTNAYSSVTIIDLRYIHADLLNQFVEFTPGSDVLFIYSSQIFNNPSILQA